MEKPRNGNEYGATELKDSYVRNLLKGLEAAALIHVVLFSIYLILYQTGVLSAGENPEKRIIKREIRIDDIEPPTINEELPEQKLEDMVKPTKEMEALEPQPVAKNISEVQTIKTQDELDRISRTVLREGDTLIAVSDMKAPIDDRLIDKNLIKDRDEPTKDIFSITEIETEPACVNFDNVRASVVYPKTAVEAGIEGRVTIKVLVGIDGSVIKTGTITGNEVFHDEVKERAKLLVFSPGLMNNKPVKVWITVPFNFKLEQ